MCLYPNWNILHYPLLTCSISCSIPSHLIESFPLLVYPISSNHIMYCYILSSPHLTSPHLTSPHLTSSPPSLPLTLPYLLLPPFLSPHHCINAGVDEQDSFSEQDDLYFRLRPVTSQDFAMAIKKLKASVDDSGKEIMKVRSANHAHAHAYFYLYLHLHLHVYVSLT